MQNWFGVGHLNVYNVVMDSMVVLDMQVKLPISLDVALHAALIYVHTMEVTAMALGVIAIGDSKHKIENVSEHLKHTLLEHSSVARKDVIIRDDAN